MKARKEKLAMLILTLSVLLMSAGCGAKEEVLFLTETASPAQTAASTEAAQETDDAKSTDSTDNATGTENADGAALTDAPVQAVYVHVCGAVQSPGVYALASGARICDAIEAAGGCSAEASADSLNLAQAVSDGMRVYVPTAQEAADAAAQESSAGENDQWVSGADADTGTAAQAESGTEALVNLNTATKEELMTLPGIGEAKAERILAYRTEHGAFESIEEIMQISGIKESTFAEIKDKIGV